MFGLGNYAKTQIIPNVGDRVKIEAVHEIDPTQLGRLDELPWRVSTAPHLFPG